VLGAVDTGGTGSGERIVRLLVQANSGNARTTTVTIAGQPFALHQEAACSYWTARSTVNWVTVAEGASGTAKGTVRLLIQANDGAARSVILTIAGQPFDLKQDGR
jgi:hypothetical protein